MVPPCKECSSLAGLSGTRTPHKQLSLLGTEQAARYRVTRHQTLYACNDCQRVLVTGRNTGWVFAAPAA
ncbi:hypothetical protein [Hydrocarboniphaga sp.]|uniref:hypothetical protein n=1 Tax=Hydrocarboniphaga sp. TaxID=2033016 RepID=UPI003D0D1067